MSSAAPGFDSQGHPVLRVSTGEQVVSVGLTGENLFDKDSSGEFAQQLLEARLRAELRRGNPPKVSENDVEHDWSLLQKALNASDNQVATGSSRPLQTGTRWERGGNRP
jgi:hypothetical protein